MSDIEFLGVGPNREVTISHTNPCCLDASRCEDHTPFEAQVYCRECSRPSHRGPCLTDFDLAFQEALEKQQTMTIENVPEGMTVTRSYAGIGGLEATLFMEAQQRAWRDWVTSPPRLPFWKRWLSRLGWKLLELAGEDPYEDEEDD